jgi:hypothetical protein
MSKNASHNKNIIQLKTAHFIDLSKIKKIKYPQIIDIGSCRGETICELKKLIDPCHIVSYEPSKTNFIYLLNKFNSRHVEFHWCAIADMPEHYHYMDSFYEYKSGYKKFWEAGYQMDGEIKKRINDNNIVYPVPIVQIWDVLRTHTNINDPYAENRQNIDYLKISANYDSGFIMSEFRNAIWKVRIDKLSKDSKQCFGGSEEEVEKIKLMKMVKQVSVSFDKYVHGWCVEIKKPFEYIEDFFKILKVDKKNKVILFEFNLDHILL